MLKVLVLSNGNLEPAGGNTPLRASLKHFDAQTISFVERNEFRPISPSWEPFKEGKHSRKEGSRHTDLGRRILLHTSC